MKCSLNQLDKNQTAYIYKIENLYNGKCYVGQTLRTPHERYVDHIMNLRRGTHHNPHLQNAWNKYGEDCFTFKVLKKTTVEFVDENEVYYIQKIGDYNIQSGGEGHKKLSSETKDKLRKISLQKNTTPEFRRLMSEISKKRWEYPEYKKRVSDSIKRAYEGQHDAVCEKSKKMWEDNTERRVAASKRMSGARNHKAKSVICLTTGERFETITEAGKHYGIKSFLKISSCCTGKRQHCGKLPDGTPLAWKYSDTGDVQSLEVEYGF